MNKETKGPKVVGKINLGERTKSYKRPIKKAIKFKEYTVSFNTWESGKEKVETRTFKVIGDARIVARQCMRNGNFVKFTNYNGTVLAV